MIEYLELNIAGAGLIRISKDPNWSTAGFDGFSFETNWDNSRFSGGVLSITIS